MSQRWRMVVWGVGLAMGLCFGRRRRGTVEEGEGVCIFSQKWRLVVWVSGLAVSLCFGGKKTSMTINNIKQNDS